MFDNIVEDKDEKGIKQRKKIGTGRKYAHNNLMLNFVRALH